MIIEDLKRKNNIEIHDVLSSNFKRYGKIIKGYDFSSIIEYAQNYTYIPDEGNIYVAEDEKMGELDIKDELQNNFFGGIDISIGYCNGKNYCLNALEYHKSSEINIAVSDLILLLGDIRDIKNCLYDSKNVEAFYIKKGTAIELYSTTLHFSPIRVFKEGFKCIVVLPKGTNNKLDKINDVKNDEDKILFAKNKWLICHPENERLIERGAFIGIVGENIKIIL